MSAVGRRVRHVRLAAATDALIRRGAILLEDALRTASLPEGAGSRVLVIRSLPVGVIRSDRSPATLALVLEQRVAELARGAVHACGPGAELAAAVYFRDDTEPPVALASLLAGALPASAWFWALAVPGYRPEAPRGEGLRLALQRLAALPAGPLAAARLVERLATRGQVDRFLAALRPEEAEALLPAGGAPARAPAALAAAPAVGDAAPALLAALARWAPAWSQGDPRATWLAVATLVAARPSRLSDPRLQEHARELLRWISAPPAAQSPTAPARAEGERASVPSPTPRDADPAAPPGAEAESPLGLPSADAPPAARSADREEPLPVPPSRPMAPGEAGQVRGSRPEAAPVASADIPTGARPADGPATAPPAGGAPGEPSPAGDEAPGTPLPTTLGGLLFLLPVLDRLGIAELARDPALADRDVPDRALLHLAERLGPPADDPMLLLLRSRLRGPASDLAPLLGEIVAGARRFCRRHARIGLRDLVCRRGRLLATETHVDVLFALRDADLRVRRAGLDVDPGWVPWFGRVVRFHYLRDGEGA